MNVEIEYEELVRQLLRQIADLHVQLGVVTELYEKEVAKNAAVSK